MNQSLAKVLYVAGVTTFCTFLGCWAVLAHQETAPTKQENARRASTAYSNEGFVRNAAEGNMAEVKLGQLAQEKAQSPEVKKFAERMINDHTKANEQLKQVANQEHINFPTDVSSKHAQTYRTLEKLSGPEFDKAYARTMLQDHEKDVAEFKREAGSAQSGPVKQYAQETLPTLESHLQEAKQMQAQVSKEGVGKGKAGGGSSRR
jgi:putative membrane protein